MEVRASRILNRASRMPKRASRSKPKSLERKEGSLGGWSNSPTRQMGELHDSFGELDQLASPPTCFYHKISPETPIETKQKAFRSDFQRQRKGGALGGWSTCPPPRMGEFDDSFGPTRRTGELDGSLGPT
ncbi:hypothetical protein DY000_02020976 [Brassica cretica]|uniref:DUF4005 domain-containing protein n=1 Tax=Brassica cretica TaxID=69181 RepID=A0ABQ7EE69_BRACR|nr:hypothetical protein DY000_02020976 [Brassica cretica]